jgi:hypothetical protein
VPVRHVPQVSRPAWWSRWARAGGLPVPGARSGGARVVVGSWARVGGLPVGRAGGGGGAAGLGSQREQEALEALAGMGGGEARVADPPPAPAGRPGRVPCWQKRPAVPCCRPGQRCTAERSRAEPARCRPCLQDAQDHSRRLVRQPPCHQLRLDALPGRCGAPQRGCCTAPVAGLRCCSAGTSDCCAPQASDQQGGPGFRLETGTRPAACPEHAWSLLGCVAVCAQRNGRASCGEG